MADLWVCHGCKTVVSGPPIWTVEPGACTGLEHTFCVECLPAAVVNDRRTDQERPWGWCVAHDTFMSGWGQAPAKSYYALAVHSESERDTVLDNLKARDEMKNIHFTVDLPHLSPGDHLSLADEGCAKRFFQPGGFRENYHK